MKTNNRMNSFRQMAERLRGENLLTTQEKLAVMAHQPAETWTDSTTHTQFNKVLLVLKPGNKYIP